MKSLIRIVLLLVVGIIAYNYFYGTEVEKDKSEKIISEFKDVGSSIVNLVKDEKEKFDDGKYDDAIDKMKEAVEKMKEKVDKSGDDSLKDEMESLGDKSEEILDKWERNMPKTEAEKEKFKEDMKRILRDAESLFEQ